MAHTTSIAWPNMFNVARNCVAVHEDGQAVVNRTALLIQSAPGEMFHDPKFGVGLRKHMYTYNTENRRAIIQDDIRKAVAQYEPYVDPASLQFAEGLTSGIKATENHVAMTVGLTTTFNTSEKVEIAK